MIEKSKKYKPCELAKLFSLHSNTIRKYESIGFISKTERGENGYRQYTERHILQLEIVRQVFAYPYTNHQIREKGRTLIKEVVSGNLIIGKQYTYEYIECIDRELKKAESTAYLLSNWAMRNQDVVYSTQLYTRKEMADLLGVTAEAVRNWERNGLIKTELRGEKNEVLFKEQDVDRMKIIYMLRQSGYSMSAIYRCLIMYDNGKVDGLVTALDELEQEELLSAGDCWVKQLKEVKKAAEKIPGIINRINQLNN